MRASNKAIAILTKYEGLQLHAYKCPAGRPTIGYGHTKGVKLGQVITKDKAVSLLREDIREVEEYLAKRYPSISQNKFDALVCLIFNIGISNFDQYYISNLIDNNASQESIIRAWSNIVYAGGKKLNGLVLRRAEEVALFFSKQ